MPVFGGVAKVVGVLLAAACLADVAAAPGTAARPEEPTVRSTVRTAAAAYGWGRPAWREEFDGTRVRSAWGVFNSPGNGGNGLRRPSQVQVAGGTLTLTGTAGALTGGIAQDSAGHRYGRWETRFRADSSGPGVPYHVVVALIPAGNADYHCGARDIDYAEFDVGAPIGFFLHALPNRQHYASLRRDTTQWHTVAVQVTPRHVTWFVDGRAVMTDRDAGMVSGLPLTMDLQLDAFVPGGLAPSLMQVDWARYYPLRGSAPAPRALRPRSTTYDWAC